MTIQVRVLSAQALAQLRALEMQSTRSAAGVGLMGKSARASLASMTMWGSRVQWMGRQLIYNFAIPIGIALGLATKFALDNEKAMVRVSKVYGDGSKEFNKLSKTEIPALGRAFEQLSNQFAVNQDQVISIAGDWAAAGASGLALAKVVKLTLETMVLGELDAAEATRDLIAIQAQYGMNTKQLTKTIDILNMVENQTGATMQDLIIGMAKAAGVAKTAGIDVEHLSAMMAALVPATGSAASAGNGLKTVISRLFASTKDATDIMHQMGIEFNENSFQALNGTQRIEAMAEGYKNLSDAQKLQVASLVASRYQFNRFSVLMDAVNNKNSFYWKSLEATSDRQKIFAQRQKELNQVLTSSPQKLSQVWNILRNAMADVIIPLIPLIVYVGQTIARMGHAFADVDPRIQKLIVAIGGFLIVFAFATRLVGAAAGLFAYLGEVVLTIGEIFFWVGKKIYTNFAVQAVKWVVTSMYEMVAAVLVGGAQILISVSTWTASMLAMTIANATRMVAVWVAQWSVFIVMQRNGLLNGLKLYYYFFAAALTGWLAWLGEMWAGFAIWRAGMLAAIAGWVIKVGVLFTLLGSFMAEALATLWAWMTVPGLLSGYILAIWGSMMGGLTKLWLLAQTTMLRIWTAFNAAVVFVAGLMSRGVAAAWIGMQTLWATILFNLRMLWMVMSAAMVAITEITTAAIAALWAALPGLLAVIGTAILAVLASPWTYAVLAILGIAYAFRDDIVRVFQQVVSGIQGAIAGPLNGIAGFFVDLSNLIVRAFWALPQGVQNALLAVLNVVKNIAVQIYEWMSYLNPFAHHSPSLVESVTAGMDEIQRQYGRASGLGSLFASAASDLAKFKNMMPKGGEFADDRRDVAKNIPKALPLFDKLVAHINKLNEVLKKQEAAVNAQQAVVDRWKDALERANAVLDRQQDKLDKLKGKLSDLQDQYDTAKAAAAAFANAPIQGMRAMSDAMFANEIAQKKLQLQMMNWEAVNGSVDDATDRLSKLYGEIDLLRGQAADLRSAGTGSEILGPIEAQIASLEAQTTATQNAINNSPINEMQAQLEALQKQGQMLQLQYDINYDPLTRQIDQLANAQKELSYDEIVAGIKAQQAAMANLQPQIEAQTAAVAAQQTYVDQLTKDRDALQEVYDRENKKLDKLNEAYNKTKDLISDISAALRDMASAATAASAAAEKAAAAGAAGGKAGGPNAFAAGAGANFPDVGGQAAIGREGGLTDQSKLIDEFTQQSLDDMNDIFGGFDMLGPIKDGWNKAWGWVVTNLGPVGAKIKSGVDTIFKGVGKGMGSVGKSGAFDWFGDVGSTVMDMVKTVSGWIGKLWDLIGPDIKKIGKAFKDFFVDIWKEVGPELAKFAPMLKDLGPAFKNIWQAIKPLVEIIGGALLLAIKLIASVLGDTLGPILHGIVQVLKYFIIAVRGVFEVIIGLLSGDWAMVWQGIKDVVVGVLGVMWESIKATFLTIWGFLWGIIQGIWGFFKWLYDELVGHSIIPDLVEGIWKWIKKLGDLAVWVWDHVLKPTWDFFVQAWNWIRDEVKEWWARIKVIWNALTVAGQWVWDNVLKPVFNQFGNAWSSIKGEVDKWWERIKTAWDGLKNAAEWIGKNVMDPVLEAFKTGWNTIKTWFSDNAGIILTPIKAVVRGIVTAINWIIKGLNKLDALPGVSISISEISLPETFAAGGIPSRRVGNGFMTSGARAIVGEGKANYPEFVIPTDPTYRSRAQGLLAMAAAKIGAPTGSPGVWGDYASGPNIAQIIKDNPGVGGKYGIGGFLGDVAGAVAHEALDLGQNALGLGADVFRTIMDPMFKLAKHEANKIDWTTGKDAAYGAIDLTEAWLDGASEAFQNALATAIANSKRGKLQKGLDFARSQAGKPYKMVSNAVGPDYYDCSGFMSAVTRAILGQNPHEPRIGSTANFPWSMYGPVTAAAKDAMSIGSTPNYAGSGTGHMAGTLLGVNIESNGSQGVVIGGRGAFSDSNFGTHAQLALRDGGILLAKHGGTLFRGGEAGQDEAVIPLPRNWKSDAFGSAGNADAGTTINFYGNLEFPNVTDGSDASEFIKNLESMARD